MQYWRCMTVVKNMSLGLTNHWHAVATSCVLPVPQAPAGSPPDVWQQLQASLQEKYAKCDLEVARGPMVAHSSCAAVLMDVRLVLLLGAVCVAAAAVWKARP